MQNSIIPRLLWKEYRVQRGFWLAVTGLGIVLQGWIFLFLSPVHEPLSAVWGVVGMFPVFYAIGCACALFGGEEEDGTLQYLKIIAAPPGRLFASKVMFFLVSLLAMLGMLGLSAFVLLRLGGVREPWSLDLQAGIFFLLLATHLFVLGIFYSLIIRKVLLSVIATALTSILCSWLVNSYSTPAGSMQAHWLLVWYLFVLGGMLLVDIWLVRRRLIQPSRSSWIREGTRDAAAERQSALLLYTEFDFTRFRVFRRLLWQEVRQSYRFIASFFITMGVLIATSTVWDTVPLVVMAVVCSPALFGLLAFHSEQRDRQFRFWSERGLSPVKVWAARQCFWLPLAIIFAATCGSAILKTPLLYNERIGPSLTVSDFAEFHLGSIVLFTLYSYGLGQLFSMLIGRVLVAGFWLYFVVGFTAYWHFGTFWLRIPPWLSVGWIFPVTMAATLVRARDWSLERNTWRAWGKFAAVLGVPTLLALVGLVIFRIVEIPDRSAEFAKLVAKYQTPITSEAKATAAMYRAIKVSPMSYRQFKGIESYRWETIPGSSKEWLEANSQYVPALIAITKREDCALTTKRQTETSLEFEYTLFPLLFISAGKLEAENKLDEAWDHHAAALRMARHITQHGGGSEWLAGRKKVHEIYEQILIWARHPGQTSARIFSAMKVIDDEAARFSDTHYAYLLDQTRFRKWIESRSLSDVISEKSISGLRGSMISLCFWERTRILRLQTAKAVELLEVSLAYEKFLDNATPDAPLHWKGKTLASDRWTRTTFDPFLGASAVALGQKSECAVQRDALNLRLALTAWRIDHGQFPERLEQLVGRYIDQVPKAPWTGILFQYFPHGQLLLGNQATAAQTAQRDAPWLWVPALSNCRIKRINTTDPPQYGIFYKDGQRASRRFGSFRGGGRYSGYVFPVQ